MRVRAVGSVAVLALGVAWACSKGGGSSTSPAPTLALAVSAGNAQSATVAHAVAVAPSVTVTSNSQAKAGVMVTFAVASGGGSVTGATATTDATGTAQVGSWTLGTTAGANTLTASVTGATAVTFTATGNAGAAAAVTKSAGDAQTASAGLALTTKPAVLVADQYGNAVAGFNVTFALASGGGSISGATSATGANGVATLGGWTLGNVAGSNTTTATSTGLTGSPLTFTETGVAGPVATLTKVAGDIQQAVAGALLSTSPSVRLADQFGNFVSSQTATFAVASGGGSVTGATPTSGANGIATVGGWTLGSTAGTNTLTASSGSAPTVTFTATGTAAFNAAQYAGNYAGNWTNTTFSSTGTSSATVTVNSGASTMSIVFVVTGTVLGTGGVNTTQGGSYTANGASVTNIAVPVMGTVTFAIDAGGNITASGTNPTNPLINRWSAVGTITPTQVRVTFTVNFTDGSTAVGNIALNHT